MGRRYAVLDVFTDRPLAGNPLAVVRDSDGLDTERMQAIAREFNLSETVFISSAANPVHSAAVRIFTPGHELPFAGHPTVGTAVLLALDIAAESPERHEQMIVLEEKVGPVRCLVSVTGPGAGHAIFDVPRLAQEKGGVPDRDALAAALSLEPADIGFENHHPTIFAAASAMTFVPVRDLEAIGRCQPNFAALPSQADGPIGLYVYCRETENTGHHFHARMFAPGLGFSEDPATGLAVALLTGVIAKFDQPPAGTHRTVIEQGFEMGRPSLIRLETEMDGGQVVAARIGGDAVVVAEGTLEA